MTKPFHLITDEEWKKFQDNPESTWGDVAKDFPQPEWCNYPNALNDLMGCWSLTARMVTGEDYCKNCDCYKSKPLDI